MNESAQEPLSERVLADARAAIMAEPSLLHPLDTFDANAIIRALWPVFQQQVLADRLALTTQINGEQLLEALDLTCQPDGIPELVIVQDHFWAAKREWEAKKAAYELVVSDIVERQTNAR